MSFGFPCRPPQSQSRFALLSIFWTAETPNHCSADSEWILMMDRKAERSGCWSIDSSSSTSALKDWCSIIENYDIKWCHHTCHRLCIKTNASSSTWFYRLELFWLDVVEICALNGQLTACITPTINTTAESSSIYLDCGCKINPETSWWKEDI